MRRTKEPKTGEEGGALTAFDWVVSNYNSQDKLEVPDQKVWMCDIYETSSYLDTVLDPKVTSTMFPILQ